jgi:hypothetical protein
MTSHEAEWDEDRGGPRNPENLISFPKDGMVHQSTVNVIPWVDCGAHAPNRVATPSRFVEKLFKMAPVKEPVSLNGLKLMTRCLNVGSYVDSALEMLVTEGLFEEEDDEGDRHIRTYTDINDLQEAADALVIQLQDRPEMEVKAGSFEWLEAFNNRPATKDGDIAWLAELSLQDVTERTGNLEVYVELNMTLGPRSTEDVRVDESGSFYTVAGQGGGGLLMSCIKSFYFRTGSAPPPAFLAKRVSTFIIETQWPAVLKIEYQTSEEYAYDLPRRTEWKWASRREWVALVQDKLPKVLERKLPTLYSIFKDLMQKPFELTAEVEAIGDLVLYGSDSVKLPLRDLEKVEGALLLGYSDMIRSEIDDGKTTAQLLTKLTERLRAAVKHDKAAVSKSEDDDVRGPKPGQISRAMSEMAYTRLETKWFTPPSTGTMSNDDKLNMFKDCLTSECVLGAPRPEGLARVRLHRHGRRRLPGAPVQRTPHPGHVPGPDAGLRR